MEILSHELQHVTLEPAVQHLAPQFADPVLALEHYHRYLYASRFVTDKRVLDVACGNGYGSAFLSQDAADVIGMDMNEHLIAQAKKRYAEFPHARFEVGKCEELPVPEHSVDVAVCFETFEHLSFEVQHTFMEKLKRSIVPGGVAIISCPERDTYKEVKESREEDHQHEFSAVEFYQFLKQYFKSVIFVGQKPIMSSMIWSLHDWRDTSFKFHVREDLFSAPKEIEQFTEPLHLIAVCSDETLSREIADTSHSVYVDTAQLKRMKESFVRTRHLKGEIEELQNDIVQLRNEYTQSTEVVQRLYAENLGLKNKLGALEKNIDERDRCLHRVEKAVAEKNETIEHLQHERSEMNGRLSPVAEENEALNGWVRQLQTDLEMQVLRSQKASEESERSIARINVLQQQVEKMEAALTSTAHERDMLMKGNSHMQLELIEKDALILNATQQIESLRSQLGDLQLAVEFKSQALEDASRKIEAEMATINRLQERLDRQTASSVNFDQERKEFQSRVDELHHRTETMRVKMDELQKHLDQQSTLSKNMFRENEGLKTKFVELQKSSESHTSIVTELSNERTALVEQVHKLQQEKEHHAEQLRLVGESFKLRLEQGDTMLLRHQEQKMVIRQMKNDMDKQMIAFDTFQKSQADLQVRYNKSQIKVQELQAHINMLEQKLEQITRSSAYKVFSSLRVFPKQDE